MKRIFASALFLALLVSLLAMPALAFDSETFWEQNGAALAARGITPYGEHEFREGLMPVLIKNTWNYQPFGDAGAQDPPPETVWNYINEKLEVVDLNQGRFIYMFPFYDGLAAVVNDDGVGYIDKTGKLVIPCQYGTYSGMGEVWVGYFHDGKATVLKEDYAMQEQYGENGFPAYSAGQWEVGKIDKAGKLVEAYHTVEGMSAGLHMVVDYGAVSDGTETAAATRYQSTAELTNACVAEMDIDGFTLTVTNPNDSYDSGTIALVLASQMGTVHFVDYELAPKESKDYHIQVVGHIGVELDKFMVVLGKGWGANLNADIITFKSDEDRDTYRSAVVYEENLDAIVTQLSSAGTNPHVVVCNGQPGDEWLKNYTGIQRRGKPHQYPEITHDICKR